MKSEVRPIFNQFLSENCDSKATFYSLVIRLKKKDWEPIVKLDCMPTSTIHSNRFTWASKLKIRWKIASCDHTFIPVLRLYYCLLYKGPIYCE